MAGLNSVTLTPKQWIARTGASGIQSKAGRYGGTYAHLDIALEFASWISVEFKLSMIKEFQRLKETERQTLGWDIRRNLALFGHTAAQWRAANSDDKGNVRDHATGAQLAALKALKKSLLHQAFSGEL